MTKPEGEMIRWGKLLFDRHLISGWGGNLSCRTRAHRFLITGQHAPLGFLSAEDLVHVDASGKPLNKKQRASSETPMHMAIYARTEAQAVVHVHPPMVLTFSLSRDTFEPLSYEEKYTIGKVPIIAQATPTVTNPEPVVEALKYAPVVIIKGHGTVAVGKNFQEAFLFTDLLEEAVRCQSFGAPTVEAGAQETVTAEALTASGTRYALFSREHMQALVDAANQDVEFRADGAATALTTSLTWQLEDSGGAWTVHYKEGAIISLERGAGGEFLISGKAEWWDAVFRARIDPFLATQQGKLNLERGELAQLSVWYKPFQRAFALWQTIPLQ